jgi:sorbitol-specific phosphotransferase system component IIC
VTDWFRKLKRWQKGGLIGLIIGIILACIILLSPSSHSLGRWIEDINTPCYVLAAFVGFFWDESSTQKVIVEYGGAASVIIFYGVVGALLGRSQQIVDPSWKWLLTTLLIFVLLGIYVIGYYMTH